MEKDIAQPTPSSPPQATAPVPTAPSAPASLPNAAIPTLDLKAALKIETAAPVEKPIEDKYGGKTYILGMIFCVLIILFVFFVAYLWMQNNNQTQQVTTIETR